MEEALKSEDSGKIRSGIQNVMDASMRLGEAIYKAQEGNDEAASSEDTEREVDEDIVDADFEDLGEDKKRG